MKENWLGTNQFGRQLNDQIFVKDLARLNDLIKFELLIPVLYGVNYLAKEITTKYSMRNYCLDE